jgi:hypothetical protein
MKLGYILYGFVKKQKEVSVGSSAATTNNKEQKEAKGEHQYSTGI